MFRIDTDNAVVRIYTNHTPAHVAYKALLVDCGALCSVLGALTGVQWTIETVGAVPDWRGRSSTPESDLIGPLG